MKNEIFKLKSKDKQTKKQNIEIIKLKSEDKKMKNTGIVRCLDDLGRITLPKEIRRVRGIGNGEPLEIYVDGDAIVLKKYDGETKCCSCGEKKDNLIKTNINHLCKDCMKEFLEGWDQNRRL